jgi:hypothetical protein
MSYEVIIDGGGSISFDSVIDIIKSDKINEYTKQVAMFDLLSKGYVTYLEFDMYIISIIRKSEDYALSELSKWKNN